MLGVDNTHIKRKPPKHKQPTNKKNHKVRFFYEAFRRLRPGAPLKALHGGMKQGKRLAAYGDFSSARGGAGTRRAALTSV